jgi:hypothetical protein
MSTNKNNEQDEMSLGHLFTKIENIFTIINTIIFKGILFFKRNIISLIILFIIGAGLGYYLDSKNKVYNQEVIVTPNISGVDFLYAKINSLSSKLKENDRLYFKSIGVKNADKIISIKIEPIIDIYNFVNKNSANTANAQNTQNFELLKLLSEDGDINKVINDELTSRNYDKHKIMIETLGKVKIEDIISPILKYLNSDEYYNKLLQIYNQNTVIKIEKNEQQIAQIDSILKIMTNNLGQSKNQNLIFNNENNQINPLFNLKNSLLNEIGSQKVDLENLKAFIKDSSITINVINTKGLNGKLKLILPLLFVFAFIFLSLFFSLYKNKKAKLSTK